LKMTKSLYGKTADGKEVFSFTIKNESGAEIELLNYGATLNKISVPDRNGDFADVLVGFDTMEGQLSCTDSQGRTVDFKNTIIILTSNLGSSAILDGIDENGRAAEISDTVRKGG